jgi:hypothetical protein
MPSRSAHSAASQRTLGLRRMPTLADVLERIVSGQTKSRQLHELLAWNWKAARELSARAAA